MSWIWLELWTLLCTVCVIIWPVELNGDVYGTGPFIPDSVTRVCNLHDALLLSGWVSSLFEGNKDLLINAMNTFMLCSN